MGDLKNKRIITVATTGAWPQKEDNPNVPLQPEEIAEEIYQCWKIGAAVAHVHIRDKDGNDSMEVRIFKDVMDLLHENHPDCDIIINLTAAGGITNSQENRMAPFKTLKPEMASFDCGTMNWMHSGVFNNNPAFLTKMGIAMQESGVKPEVEVFDAGMIYDAAHYLKKGVLKAPLHFQFCMGCAGGIGATMDELLFMKKIMDKTVPGSTWSAFGIGKGAMEVMFAAIAAGGNIRVGMEDNVMYSKGQLAESNMQLIARARRVIEEYGCEVATSDEARVLLSLK
ncbi:MAG: 3-keto-5-aminohexanoate cleavage protein [Emergencia timonensis]|uniref:3-keto-5-aminohexanoate cleavage protein n=1 Tax=Emergencia timonensis TaxID=1776384 RepID=UPI00082EBF93|nr:3-keto-5-aminohexanoate cleavage protein [Emergencia timonensis]WNX89222.1 3-keto-5-aminohexanoate cleavage protein [Emergencia timonensis]